MRRARFQNRLRPEDEAELAGMVERVLETPAEAYAPPDPLDPFADDAANRLEQD